MPIPLPTGWSELESNNVAGVTAAFALLEGTFPKRYLHLDVAALGEKMDYTRQENSVDVPALRIFTTGDIAAFFWLRFLYSPKAYCLTAGISAAITSAQTLHDSLYEICKYVQNEDGVQTIDIVNQRMLPANLDDTPRAVIVAAAFTIASDANHLELIPRSDIFPGPPWPSKLMRWELVALP
jgi:hypothetical protein